MKRFFTMLSAIVIAVTALSGCGKSAPKGVDVTGEWELVRSEVKSVTIGDETVTVYLKFAAGAFDIYQIVGAGRPRHFSGTYTLEGNVLNGAYSDGKKWAAPYDVAVDGGNLVLTTVGTAVTGVDTYSPCSIPAAVLTEAF